MEKRHFEYYYKNKLSSNEKCMVNAVLSGKDFDELSIARKTRISLIIIPDEINFFQTDEKTELVFDKNTNEYDMFDKMSQEEYDIYSDLLCSRGIIIEYNNKEDCWKIS